MKTKENSKMILKNLVNYALKGSANSTTCSTIYQPKAPNSLKKFSKIENDK